MLPMLVVKKRMNTLKKLSKKDNVHQKLLDITQLSKNNDLKNVIKSIDLHFGSIKV
jgi:hypothetical protein